MSKIEFGIKKDMNKEELYNELHGRISGETQGQAAMVMQTIKEGETDIFIDPKNEYSLIRITATTQDMMNCPVNSYRYFLIGVNDEGLYFTHELNAEDVWQHKTFEELLAWVNRADEGFSTRIQGDILLQFVKLVIKGDRESSEYSSRIEFELRLINGRDIGYRWEKLDPQRYTVENMMGNHKIISNNIYMKDREYWLVQDKELILEHPQHGITKIGIPEGFAVLLATQRGRAGTRID